MLTPLRNMLRSPAAGGIFVLVIIAMAAWGVTDIFAGGSGSNLISAGAEAARTSLPEMADAVWRAAENLREATETLVGQDMDDRFAGAVPYLMAWARVLGGHVHLSSAMAEQGKGARAALARFFIQRLLPEHAALLEQARAGADGVFALSVEDLAVA